MIEMKYFKSSLRLCYVDTATQQPRIHFYEIAQPACHSEGTFTIEMKYFKSSLRLCYVDTATQQPRIHFYEMAHPACHSEGTFTIEIEYFKFDSKPYYVDTAIQQPISLQQIVNFSSSTASLFEVKSSKLKREVSC